MTSEPDSGLQPGTRVRLKGDPGRIGVLTGKTKSRVSHTLHQVVFPDGTSWVPKDQLEIVPEGPEHPLDLLQQGKIGLARDLRRAMTHVRLTGRLADVIYSMETTGTDFYAYQFKPVLKLLNAPSEGILIADEVGLGKTIEAGLAWTELRSRFDYRRLMVLCPAFLREKWRRELYTRFGIDPDIVSASEAVHRLERSILHRDDSDFALIGSIQGLRPPKGWREAEEVPASGRLARLLVEREHEPPLIDFLVIDEAHYLRNPETQSAELGRLLRNVSSHIALLTATPIHLRNQDLYQLLNLIDAETFRHHSIFEDILHANRPLVKARDLVLSRNADPEGVVHLLEKARSHHLLEDNKQIAALLESPPTSEELDDEESIARLAHRLETVNLTAHSINRTRKRDVQEWRVVRKPVDESVVMSDVERRFYESVTRVVRDACAHVEFAEGLILVTPQRQMSSSMPAALRYWLSQQDSEELDEQVYEDFGVDTRREEPGPILRRLIDSAKSLGSYEELYRNDSKYARLRDRLREFFAEHPHEKVVLFSYFRATLAYLHDRLSRDGIENLTLVGGNKNKDQVIEDFENAPGGTVLLSSEVGSEGIDLQFCRVIVNYDLPWNPMKIEQRIGRLDRLGQKAAQILIWNIFYGDTIDDRIYNRLYQRLRIFENALGEMESILGEELQRLTADLFRDRLTPEQEEERIRKAAIAVKTVRHQEEKLENEAAHLVAYGDYILRQIKAAQDLHRTIRAEDLRTYVLDFFRQNFPGSRFRQKRDDSLEFEVDLSNKAKMELESFIQDRRLSGQTRLAQSRSEPIRCRFENTVVNKRGSRVEKISQFHPLVRFINDKIGEEGARTAPAVAVELPRSVLESLEPDAYVFVVQHWSIGGLREVEKLSYAAASMSQSSSTLSQDESERLVMASANHGMDWPAAKGEVDFGRVHDLANDVLIVEADDRFEKFLEQVTVENEDRAAIQESSVKSHRDNQLSILRKVKDEHLRRGRDSLAKATEGKMNALENRIERQLRRIKQGREITHRKDEICVGVVRVV